MPSKPDPFAQACAWNQVDHQLVILKLSKARKQIDERYHLPIRTPHAGDPFGVITRVHIERAREWAEKVYGIYNEVWEKQGKAKTPAFLRVVLEKAIQPAIGASVGNAKGELKLRAMRTSRPASLGSHQAALALAAERLKGEWRNRIGIEVRELELDQARRRSQARQPGVVQANPGQVFPVQETSKSDNPKRQSKPKALRDSDPDIIKRRAIVDQKRQLNAQGICELFDANGIPLTKKLKESGSWGRAFRAPHWRHSVESLISRDRRATSA